MVRAQAYFGKEIESVFDPLAQLRIAVFRAYPYLYEGSLNYELEYLKTYSNSERAMLFALWDENKMVGATTCIPLLDETADVQAPFLAADIPLESVFYFGESILLDAYRGQGFGKRFFDVREEHATQFPEIEFTCFCAVKRGNDHPLKPDNYKPLDDFWTSRGYHQAQELQSTFMWPDIGELEDSPKEMIYWKRNIER